MRHLAALATVLALAACGESAGRARTSPDLDVRGVGIVLHTTAAFAHRPDFAPRVEDTVTAALAYWGGSWSQLSGRVITFEGDGAIPCGDATSAVGCFDGDLHVATRERTVAYTCVEETALVHEIGHAVLGDAEHADPRWVDFADVARRLQGRVGYGDAGEVPCDIFLSLWRHPPGR